MNFISKNLTFLLKVTKILFFSFLNWFYSWNITISSFSYNTEIFFIFYFIFKKKSDFFLVLQNFNFFIKIFRLYPEMFFSSQWLQNSVSRLQKLRSCVRVKTGVNPQTTLRKFVSLFVGTLKTLKTFLFEH